MIERLIEGSMRNRFLVACMTLFIAGFGIRAVLTTPVDAIPDLSENQVIVFADWTGRSPQEVEDQVTYPLSVNLQGLAGVKTVRATSMFGFSLITIIFGDEIDNYFARQRVLERLNYLGGTLPTGVEAKLGPDATGLGWVYQYYLDVDASKSAKGGFDLGELRSLQDWFIRYQLNSVPGVAEVGSIGGMVKQYQIEVDSAKMRAVGVSLNMVMTAMSQSNLNVGGKTIEENGMEFVVRGLGLVKGVSDIEQTVLLEKNGTPIYLRDIARVELGGDFRRGVLDLDGREVVGGTVVMRTGENARDVIQRVKAKIAQIQTSLPAGVTIKPFYDRSELIDRTLDTLKHALLEEMILVTLAHIIFLFHFRSILIVTFPLPLSILISFILMKQIGLTSNIMSLSGIAIAIGVLVDAAIVLTENVIRHCEHAEEKKGSCLLPSETFDVVLAASKQVGRPIFFAMAIIILAFIPVFSLTGQEGKLFHPLAFTKTFAMIGSTFLAVTIVPVLCTVLVRGPFHAEDKNIVMRFLLKLYEPALDFALRKRKTIMAMAGLILASGLIVAFGLPSSLNEKLAAFPRLQNLTRGIGKEFMPPLNEGSLLYMPTFVPATALSEVKRVMSWQDRVIKNVPEVLSAAGKLGRADTATDPAPTEMIETTIMLKPESEWRPGMTKQKLIAELTEKLQQVPGSVPGFLQPIENRVLMISTGIRAQVGVKLLGENLNDLQKWAFEVEKVVKEVSGAIGTASSRVQGKPYIEIEVNREAMARYGLRAQDVLDMVETGLGGKNVSTAIEGRARFPIQVRLQRSEREDLERLRDVLVTSPSGKVIPLGQVATIKRVEGPNEIVSENGRLRVFVQTNVDSQKRDLGSFVEEVKTRINKDIVPRLPPGVTVDYSGEYENQIRAAKTLQLIVPTVLFIIFILLYMVYHNAKEAAHVILAVPFALSGGVFLQYFMGFNFSVAVWVGYIALFGTAIQTGVVMVVYLEEALEQKKRDRGAAFNFDDLVQAVKEGARLRLRPKVMTVATIVASLLPIMWSTRTGAEVMKPLATPVIGGMLSSLIHILIVTPVIFVWLRKRELDASNNH
jgi:Cu(I)/Ag(I) efflux system membrane protein CusA/SilA